MSFTLEEAMSLHDRLTPKELEIARLKESEAKLIKERDYWQARALEAEGKKDKERKSKGRFIVISAEKLKKVLSTIHNVNILSLVFLVLHKSFPNDSSAEDTKQLCEIIPLPNLPRLTLTANGDINVNGNYNEVHDNEEVNFLDE